MIEGNVLLVEIESGIHRFFMDINELIEPFQLQIISATPSFFRYIKHPTTELKETFFNSTTLH